MHQYYGRALKLMMKQQDEKATKDQDTKIIEVCAKDFLTTSGPEVIKLSSSSAQLRLKFILLIIVKMPTIVGILTFISRINYMYWL